MGRCTTSEIMTVYILIPIFFYFKKKSMFFIANLIKVQSIVSHHTILSMLENFELTNYIFNVQMCKNYYKNLEKEVRNLVVYM